ncbi:uncharacterized protein M6B38_176490 [Iris pallida]|uniref:Uncharacterized protein n=1 Tax=Iris pallida TaxID=29817 RepID=A0AAX6EQ53_IRIPA|nr:uncharacterized protein M6B38_176490 [Iris pallida]
MGSARVLPARHEFHHGRGGFHTQRLRHKGGRPQEEELLESAAATLGREVRGSGAGLANASGWWWSRPRDTAVLGGPAICGGVQEEKKAWRLR